MTLLIVTLSGGAALGGTAGGQPLTWEGVARRGPRCLVKGAWVPTEGPGPSNPSTYCTPKPVKAGTMDPRAPRAGRAEAETWAGSRWALRSFLPVAFERESVRRVGNGFI